MKTSIKTLLVASALTIPPVFATSFSTTVAVDNQLADLTVTESVALTFPSIVSDGTNNVNGASCSSWDGVSGNLCPTAILGTDRITGQYTINGTPNDAVTVSYSNSDVIAGLQIVVPSSLNTQNLTLNSSGSALVQGYHNLIVVDSTQVIDGDHSFSYSVIATYQ